MGRKKEKCGLCSVKQKSRQWDDDNFFGLICKEKLIPMIVLKEHKNELSEEELEDLEEMAKKHYPQLKINPSLKHVNGHYCIYLRR